MVNRNNNASDDSGSGGADGFIVGAIKDRIIVALLAVIAGGGGAFGFLNLNPEVARPNPWTSLDADRAHSDIYEHLERYENKSREQDRHIRQMERDCATTRAELRALEKRFDRLGGSQ